MLDEFVGLLVTACVVMSVWVVKPRSAQCPDRWYLDTGIRPSGAFRCVPDLVGDVNDPAGGVDRAVQPPGEITGRIYCTGGSVPIVVDYNTVGCTRR